MYRIAIIFIVGLISINSYSQELVPFLGNNLKYGISDNKGKIIVPSQFDKITKQEEFNVFITQLDKKFGLLHYPSCKELIPPISTSRPYYGKLIVSDKNPDNSEKTIDKFNTFQITKGKIVVDPKNIKKEAIKIDLSNYKTKKFKNNYLDYNSISFIHDLFRYKRIDGKINFYHKNGYNLLKKDVINGIVFTNNKLLIEGKNGKLGLMDFKENMTIPFIYDNIELLNNDAFIVNSGGYSYGSSNTNNSGLISSKGEILIDTVYYSINAIEDKWVIIKNNDFLNGLFNSKGKEIIEIKYNQISKGSKSNIILKLDDNFKIIDLKSMTTLEDSLTYANYNYYDKYYKITDSKGITKVLDDDFNTIYTGPYLSLITAHGENSFIIKQDNKTHLVIKNGKIIREFDNINQISKINLYRNISKKYYKVLQDTLQGVLDENFNTILETKYTDITTLYNKTLNFLAKTNMYEIFDSLGKRLNLSPIPDPIFINPNRTYIERSIEGKKMLLFRDGSLREKPDYNIGNQFVTQNKEILYVSKTESGERYYILNSNLYNIIPNGYWIPKKYYYSNTKKYGLITVYDDFNSGIINDRGEWEIAPSYNGYQTNSPTSIIRKYGIYEGVDLLIKKNGKWNESKYDGIKYEYKNKTYEVYKKVSPNSKEILTGILDSLGNAIIPMKYNSIKSYKYFISGFKKLTDSTGMTDIYDISGRLMFSTPYKIPYGYYSDSTYIKIADIKTNLEGFINYDNNIIVKPEYKRLSYFTELNLIKYEKGDYKTKKSYLADLSGKIIYESKNFGIKTYTSNSIKRAVVYDNKQTLIFDDKLQLLATVNLKFNHISTNFIGYIECKNESNNTIFVNLFDGTIMQE